MVYFGRHEVKAVPRLTGIDLVVDNGPEFIEATRYARNGANHYKGFNVGCFVVATAANGDVGLMSAANQNLYPGNNPSKICAEPIALQKAFRHGLIKVLMPCS